MANALSALRRLPSVDEMVRAPGASNAVERYGRPAVVNALRDVLAEARSGGQAMEPDAVMDGALARLEAQAQPSLRAVFNLTGTVLHTNLGRALIAEEAIEAAIEAMRNAVALEFDLADGK